jgi:hypothetical protein
VDDDSYGYQMKVTPNLTSKEIRIDHLIAKGCPLSESCIRVVNQGVSSICEYLGIYLDFNTIFCRKDENDHDVKFLMAGKYGPLKAVDIDNAHIPTGAAPGKSNAFVVMK